MKTAIKIAFVLFILFFLGACSLEYQAIDTQEYNLFVRGVIYIFAFILKGILTILALIPLFFSFTAFIIAIILDIIMSVVSLDLIFPLTKLVWNLDLLLVNTIVEIWTKVPPIIYVKPAL